MMQKAGFTTVELLITLFVAAVFLAAGFQLYNVIIQDSGNARAASRASNEAYSILRSYSESAANPCVASSPLSNEPRTVNGLASVDVSVAISCPYNASGTSAVSKVEVTLRYNDPQRVIRHSTLVDKSKGAS